MHALLLQKHVDMVRRVKSEVRLLAGNQSPKPFVTTMPCPYMGQNVKKSIVLLTWSEVTITQPFACPPSAARGRETLE